MRELQVTGFIYAYSTEMITLCIRSWELSSCLRPQMPSKSMVIALILIYDISSALLEPKIAMEVILDPKKCEFKLNTVIPIQLHEHLSSKVIFFSQSWVISSR